MLSVGPGARQFSPSKDLPIGKSPHVGNIHYRQLPGYRLEVKTAGSGVSSQPSCAALPLVVGEFLIFEMECRGDRPFGSAADARWERIRTSWGALFASREAEARYRCRAREAGIAVGAFENRGDVGGGRCTSIVRKLEIAKRATARGSRLENVDVTFCF